jgi:hypothetical protein
LSTSDSALPTRLILAQWFPLAVTWAMMAAEGLIIQSVLSRLPGASVELAAFGVAIGIAFIVESPIIMLLSASTAYVKSAHSYRIVRKLAFILSLGVTLVMAALLLPPLYHWLSSTLLALPAGVSRRVYMCIAALLLWPGAIGVRRFYQGILIGAQMSRAIAFGTTFRLGTILLGSGALLLWWQTATNGATIGAALLSVAVTIEMLATWLMARPAVRRINQQASGSNSLTLRRLLALYVPLGLTSVITMGMGPVLTAFMARFPEAIASLAVFPVVDGFVFQFRSPSFAYQEVAIAFFGRVGIENRRIAQVGYGIALISTIALSCIVVSPFSAFVYGTFPYQLDRWLIPLAVTATAVLLPLPIANAVYSIERARLIAIHRTDAVTYSTVIEAGGTIAVLALLAAIGTELVGIHAVSIAITAGKILASFYLLALGSRYRSRRAWESAA